MEKDKYKADCNKAYYLTLPFDDCFERVNKAVTATSTAGIMPSNKKIIQKLCQ